MAAPTRRRLDAELVRRGLAPSREAARRLVAAGVVLVGGAVADKAARQVGAGEAVRLSAPPPRYVSRAGAKLEAALEEFAVDPSGRRCLDAGSSTGGFTDCLLQRGAAGVVSVDVGTNQLHERLRADPRVDVHERTDVRRLDRAVGPFPLIVGDLSFVSLRLVLADLVEMASPRADLLLLIKPQFEAGRIEASRGKGVITDPDIWRRVIHEVADAAASQGAAMLGIMPSPITGSTGNVEFVARFVVGAAADVGQLNTLTEAAVDRALDRSDRDAADRDAADRDAADRDAADLPGVTP